MKQVFANRFLKGKRGEMNRVKANKIMFTTRTAVNVVILNVSELREFQRDHTFAVARQKNLIRHERVLALLL